jgi:hypothetical protein
MLFLTRRQMGSLATLGLGETLLKALLASGVMTAIMALLLLGINRVVGDSGLLVGFATVTMVSGAGLLAYTGLIMWLRVEEVSLVWRIIQRWLAKFRFD